MKKFILSTIILISFGFYVIFQNNAVSPNDLALATPIDSSKKNTEITSLPSRVASTLHITNNAPKVTQNKIVTKTTIPIVKKVGLYKNGEYTGDPAFAYNDNIQVKAIISNSKITDIQFVQYPTTGRSGKISSFSLPTLKQEAISAQSAKINAVSGASYTSPAFIKSLTSALEKAKV